MSGHSPDVKIYLITEDQDIRISSVIGEEGTLYDKDFEPLPPETVCHLLITIDGAGSGRKVVLPDGLSPDQETFWFKMQEHK